MNLLRTALSFLFSVTTLLTLVTFTLSAQNQTWRAGAAQSSITPKKSCYLAGYGGAGMSVGVHDSLYAKAVVISDGRQTAAVLTLDCIGLLYPDIKKIQQRVKVQLNDPAFPVEHIIVSSTHTHLGPDVVGLWGKNRFSSGVQKDYMDFLIQKAAETVIRAWKNRTEVSIRYGTGSHGEGWVQNISLPEEIDRSVTTLQLIDASNQSVATLTNFACHPTLIGPERKLFSADYVAGLYQHLDTTLGGVNLFLQGAIGGWVQPVGEDSFENAGKRGNALAEEVLKIMASGQNASAGELIFKRRVFDMPVASKGFRLLSRLGVLDRKIRKTVTTEIAWLRIGNISMVTHPGETSPAYSLQTKKLLAGDGPVMVLGLAQDALGYLLKPEFFDQDKKIPHADYLTMVSVGKNGGEVLMKNITELVSNR